MKRRTETHWPPNVCAIWHISSVCGCGFDQVSPFSPDVVPKPLSPGRDAPITFQSRVWTATAKLHSHTQCSSHRGPEKRTSLHRQETTLRFRHHMLETAVISEGVSVRLCKSTGWSYFRYHKKHRCDMHNIYKYKYIMSLQKTWVKPAFIHIDYCYLCHVLFEAWKYWISRLSMDRQKIWNDIKNIYAAVFPRGIENGIEYRCVSRYCIEIRNSSLMTTLACLREYALVIVIIAKYQWNRIYHLRGKYCQSKTRRIISCKGSPTKPSKREFWSDHRSADWIYRTAQINLNNFLQHPHHPTPKPTWLPSWWILRSSQRDASLKFKPPHLSSLTGSLFWKIWWQSKSK